MNKGIIKRAWANNRKRLLLIDMGGRELALPFSRLPLPPAVGERLSSVEIDAELAKRAVTYRLSSGKEASVHLDAFLDYNRDPSFMKEITVYRLTLLAIELQQALRVSKAELQRRLGTSASQLCRLLDPSNKSKTIDQMLRLLCVLGCEASFSFTLRGAAKKTQKQVAKSKLRFRVAA